MNIVLHESLNNNSYDKEKTSQTMLSPEKKEKKKALLKIKFCRLFWLCLRNFICDGRIDSGTHFFWTAWK